MKKSLVRSISLVIAVILAFCAVPLTAGAAQILGANLAHGKAVFSETSYHDGGQWNLAALTDGKKIVGEDYAQNAGYHSKGEGDAAIFGVDLGVETVINMVRLYPRSDTQGPKASYVVDFDIQVSTDQAQWTTVKSVTDNPLPAGAYDDFSFDETTARYVRLNVTKAGDGTGNTTALAEMEIYNVVTEPDTPPDALLADFTEVAFEDDFSNVTESNAKWQMIALDGLANAGNPSLSNGEFTLQRGTFAIMQSTHKADALFEAEVKVGSGADWIGLQFNKTNKTALWGESGYMLYLRPDGDKNDLINWMRGADKSKSYATIPNHTAGDYVRLQVLCDGGKIIVFVNGQKVMNIEDDTYKGGYANFFVSGSEAASAKIRNVSIKTRPVVYEDQTTEYFQELQAHKILRDDKLARFPKLPDGHTLKINTSSNEGVIGLDGTVVPPNKDETVTLNVTVTCKNPQNAKTDDVTYTVPRKSTADDIAFAQGLEYGVFLHYIWGGAGSSTIDENGAQPATVSDFVNNFDVEQVAADCAQFNPQYVIFTAWHYRMNPLYYSEVHREWRSDADENNPKETDRDIIMELADALKKEGIDLLLYIHPNDLHDFSAEDKAKFDYKYQGDTSFNRELWNDYLSQQCEELAMRYQGKIKGYFVDEGLGSPPNTAFVDYDRLRAVLKTADPGSMLIQNWSEVPGSGAYTLDTGMVEDRIQTSWGNGDWGDSLKTSITNGNSWPSFGLSFAARMGERPFNWSAQYDKNGTFRGADSEPFQSKKMVLASAPDMFRYTVYQAASNNEGMGTSWAFGPYSGTGNTSLWEPGVKETLTEVGTLLSPIQEAVFNTKPSASWPAKIDVDKARPRVKTGSLGDVTYVAMSSMDGTREFVHVLNPKLSGGAVSGKTLTLPAPKDGTNYSGAKLVDGGASLGFSKDAQGKIQITLGATQEWDEYDTAIELLSDPNQVAAVTATPPAGTYMKAQSVALQSKTTDARIYYTTDGSIPTTSSTLYTQKINVDKSMTIKAIALKDGMTNSEVAEFKYAIEDPFAAYTAKVFEDDFSNADESAAQWSKTPDIQDGAFKIPLTAGGAYLMGKNQVYGNSLYEFEMSTNGGADWNGLLFNISQPTDNWDKSGYLVYLRGNGTVDLYAPSVKVSASGTVPNYAAGEMVPFQIIVSNGTIQVYAKGEKIIDVEDSTYTSGYAGFWCSGHNGFGMIDNVKVSTLPDDDATIAKTFAEIEAGLKKIKVYVDETTLRLPNIGSGYEVKVESSSDKSVVDLNGNITPPAADKKVTLGFVMRYPYGQKPAEKRVQVEVSVPRGTTPEDTAFVFDQKYGLFVHYVWSGSSRVNGGDQAAEISARYPDGTNAQTIDEMIQNFDAEQFAEDCEAFGMQYVIFTVWHYSMNPLYPSSVYEKWRTHGDADLASEDLIDKVYQELNKKGIDLYLYTHPYDIHDLPQADKDKFDYKYQGDLTFDYDLWNDYLNEQYEELCKRYQGKIKGMFLDEGLANPANNLSVDYPRLRNTVKSVDPTLYMVQNEYNGKYSCDSSMWELPTAWHGGQYNNLNTWQTNTLSIGTSVGHIYQGYSWWAIKDRGAGTQGIEKAEDAFLYTVLQAGTNTEGLGLAWAAGPYCGSDEKGIWEDGIRETLIQMYDYLKPVEDTVKNTRPSKSFVTPAKSTYASVDWGVATETADGKTTYLHVVKPPKDSKTLRIGIPKDGKKFTDATLYVSGKEVRLVQDQNGVTLTLPDDAEWDKLDTVIELKNSNVAVESVTISQSTATIEVGASQTLRATILPEAATNKTVMWESDNASVARVNNGVVTGIKAGKAMITVKTQDGNKTARCTVTVKAASTIVDEIKNAPDGASVEVPVNSSGAIPPQALEAARGRNVNLVIQYDGYTWTINGKNITGELADAGYDLRIKDAADETLKGLAQGKSILELDIAHDGALPFKATLRINVGSEHNGKTLHLYYYGEAGGKLVYQSACVATDGFVTFDFTRCSKYVVTTEVLKTEETPSPTPSPAPGGTAGTGTTGQGTGGGTPKTGDTANTGMWLVLCIAAGVAIAGTAAYMLRKKRKHSSS